jgi:hypothetical protein
MGASLEEVREVRRVWVSVGGEDVFGEDSLLDELPEENALVGWKRKEELKILEFLVVLVEFW